MLFSNGAMLDDLGSSENVLQFQRKLLRTQLHLEDTFFELAMLSGKPSVLLCDRGTMDGSAYMAPAEWEELLRAEGTDNVALRDARYNAVLHLVTAAIGAEKYYTLENNVARTESPEQAAEVDRKLQLAWVGHPRLLVFDNSTDFEGKLQRIVDTVSQLVGLPSSKKSFRKYVLGAQPELCALPVRAELFTVEKVYLRTERKSERDYTFVRRRMQGKLASHGFTSVRHIGGQRVEVKRIISAREYSTAVAQRADPARHVVRLQRASFLWENCYFEVYSYQEPWAGMNVLLCQVADHSFDVPLPPWLDVRVEVTHDDTFSAYHISIKDKTTDHMADDSQAAPRPGRALEVAGSAAAEGAVGGVVVEDAAGPESE